MLRVAAGRPVAVACLLSPGITAIGALILLENAVSSVGYQQSIIFRYTVVASSAIALATVHALR